jgi:hypothetical protein
LAGDFASAGVLSPSGTGLLLNGLSDPDRDELARLLDTFVSELEILRNPLLENIEGRAARVDLERWLSVHAPTLAAATALAAGRWDSPERDFTARLSEHCLPIRGDSQVRDPLQKRARFLAWPITHSIVLQAMPPSSSRELAVHLRATARPGASTVALVLDRSELHALRHSDALPDLAHGVAQILTMVRGDPELEELFGRLGRSDPARDELPWLSLPDGSVLVVPRLATLSAMGRFVDELRTLLASSPVRVTWVYLPPEGAAAWAR